MFGHGHSINESRLKGYRIMLPFNSDGGHAYITITFYGLLTGQSIAVVKSCGIGLSISQDQSSALGAILGVFIASDGSGGWRCRWRRRSVFGAEGRR